ncbi:MAG: SIMPL domain-containing protein [Cycloclasticus sp.]
MKKWILALSLSFLLTPAFADETKPKGIVNLQASASLTVDTDLMLATLAVEAENHDPALLAKTINKKMAWAMSTSKPFSNIKLKGGQYSSQQIFHKRIFKAWRGSQSITLQSKNTAELGKLIGLLQEQLLVKSIRYQVSKEKLAQSKQGLLKQAIANFRNKATFISQQFEKSGYTLQTININSNTPRPPVFYAKSRMMSSAPMSEAAPANLQQNTSIIQVNVNGSIQLVN